MKTLKEDDIFLTDHNNVFIVNWRTKSRASCKYINSDNGVSIIFNINSGKTTSNNDPETFVKVLTPETNPEYFL